MSNLEGPTFNNVNKLANYYRNQKYITQKFLLTTGSGLTLDLTGINGTIKSAFIEVEGSVDMVTIESPDTATLNSTFILNGSTFLNAKEIARTTQTYNGNYSWNSTASTTIIESVSSGLNLNTTNMYTLSWSNASAGHSVSNQYLNAELVLTFEPEGL